MLDFTLKSPDFSPVERMLERKRRDELIAQEMQQQQAAQAESNRRFDVQTQQSDRSYDLQERRVAAEEARLQPSESEVIETQIQRERLEQLQEASQRAGYTDYLGRVAETLSSGNTDHLLLVAQGGVDKFNGAEIFGDTAEEIGQLAASGEFEKISQIVDSELRVLSGDTSVFETIQTEDGTYIQRNTETGEERPSPRNVDNRAPTTAQSQAAGFAQRIIDSNGVIDSIGEQFTGAGSRAAGFTPQGLKSEERQVFDQATRNFINATLRRESGAAISPDEFTNANAQYIPQPGDSPEVLAAKTRNRRVVGESLRLEAGQAFENLNEVVSPLVTVNGRQYEVGSTQEINGVRVEVLPDGRFKVL